MEYELYPIDGELMHWGIKGMRWGIRRYQNKDGSLTAAGKKRYDAELAKVKEQEATVKRRKATQAKLDKLAARKKAVEEEKKALDEATGKKKKKPDSNENTNVAKTKSEKKSVRDMTDEELNAAINRARMEDTYNQLRPAAEKHPIMKKLMSEVVAPAAISSGKKFLESTFNQLGEKALKSKADPNSIDELKKLKEKLQLKQDIEKLKSGKSTETQSWDDKKKKAEYEKMMADKELDDLRRANNIEREKRAAQKITDDDSHSPSNKGGESKPSDNAGSNTSNTSNRSAVTETKSSGSSVGRTSPITSTRASVNSFINKVASQPIRSKNPDVVVRVRGNTVIGRRTKVTTGTTLNRSDVTFASPEQTSAGKNYVQQNISRINWRDMNWDDE